MLLCLDIGNTHILVGVFKGEKLVKYFRYSTPQVGTSDQFGIFLRNILHENDLSHEDIKKVALCSVVPGCNYSIRHAINNYFSTADFFNIDADIKKEITIKYKDPHEVGADRIASAIGAIKYFPNKNIIIVDAGTATTFCAVNNKKEYLGGAIMAGVKLSMEALSTGTAKLMDVDIEEANSYLGESTKESLQSGIYYGHLGAIKEITSGLKQELFNGDDVIILATGGFSNLFNKEGVFNKILPDLVLQGIKAAYEYSKNN